MTNRYPVMHCGFENLEHENLKSENKMDLSENGFSSKLQIWDIPYVRINPHQNKVAE